MSVRSRELASVAVYTPLFSGLLLEAKNRKRRGGRIWGQLWAVSPREPSGAVSADAVPPEAATRNRPLKYCPNKMKPSLPQAPPRPGAAISQMTCDAPPETSERSSLVPAKKPMDPLVGDQNGSEAASP